MSRVQLTNVYKSFGASRALMGLSIEIASGELVCLLGPSGCGKTTALRILAGFERPDLGTVHVDGMDITDMRPERRGFGMVFQDYSLFPNMTARQNIEFGLRVKRTSKQQRGSTVNRMLELTGLQDHRDKFPHQLSGGQKQRVALARALATSPRLLLLDEPLSALDAKVREYVRDEIRRLQQESGVTTVFVTHDQNEALAIADRVAVMSSGLLEQFAHPQDLYEHPENAFVAGFIGTINWLPAQQCDGQMWQVLHHKVASSSRTHVQGPAKAAIRPESIILRRDTDSQDRVISLTFMGPITRVRVSHTDLEVIADLPSSVCAMLRPGDPVTVDVDPCVERALIVG